MKNLWKFAAALAVIAGAVVIIARFGDKFLAKLQGLRAQCCGVGGCTCGERLADMAGEAADAVHEAVENATETAQDVAGAVKDAVEDAVETVKDTAQHVTEEDFAD